MKINFRPEVQKAIRLLFWSKMRTNCTFLTFYERVANTKLESDIIFPISSKNRKKVLNVDAVLDWAVSLYSTTLSVQSVITIQLWSLGSTDIIFNNIVIVSHHRKNSMTFGHWIQYEISDSSKIVLVMEWED